MVAPAFSQLINAFFSINNSNFLNLQLPQVAPAVGPAPTMIGD